MTLVVDPSVAVAALVDGGPVCTWAVALLTSTRLAAPHLMPVEAANILRRASISGDLTRDTASLAHADLLDLRVALFPYQPFAERVWELRGSVTCFDAWYVCLAESLNAKLATLDLKLSCASGVNCAFLTPDDP